MSRNPKLSLLEMEQEVEAQARVEPLLQGQFLKRFGFQGIFKVAIP